MTATAITILFYAVAVAACFQPNAPRLFAALIFVAFALLHEWLLADATGLRYYSSAALFDLAIIVLTSGIRPLPKMVLHLHIVCMVSVLANFGGFWLWYSFHPSIVYNLTFVAIYAWALFVLIKRTDRDVGGYALDSWRTCFRFDWDPWFVRRIKNKGPI
jgi:hypothetical protein